ncbi:MAG: cytochrome oxidase putative small subunit CydP [Pseudomonadota bacterium]
MRLRSLNPFRDTTGRPRSPLGREIAAMLAVKMFVLYGIWNAFFSQPVLPKMIQGMDPDRVAAVLVAPDAVSPRPTFDSPSQTHSSNPNHNNPQP